MPRVQRGAVCNRQLRSEYANGRIVGDILHGVLYHEFCGEEFFSGSTRDEGSRRLRRNASSNFAGERVPTVQFVISFDLFKSRGETNNTDKSKSRDETDY